MPDDDEVIDTTGGIPVVRDNTEQSALRTAVIALMVIAVCVGVGALSDAQVGTLMMAGASFGGAAVRMALPAGVSFSVRRRTIDVSVMVAFGIALTYLGLSTPLS